MVGAVTGHVISFSSPVPLDSTDAIIIWYPDDTSPPKYIVNCVGSGALSADQSCLVVQDIVRTDGLNPAYEIIEGSEIQLSIYESLNPLSSKPTGSYLIDI